MAKAKKKTVSKAVAAALKAMENMVFETTDLDAQLKQFKEKLSPLGVNTDFATVTLAGVYSSGSNQVSIIIGSSTFASPWPEWAYTIAEDALHFSKQLLLMYNNEPFGSNLLLVLCSNLSI
jgi:hypothetical protein